MPSVSIRAIPMARKSARCCLGGVGIETCCSGCGLGRGVCDEGVKVSLVTKSSKVSSKIRDEILRDPYWASSWLSANASLRSIRILIGASPHSVRIVGPRGSCAVFGTTKRNTQCEYAIRNTASKRQCEYAIRNTQPALSLPSQLTPECTIRNTEGHNAAKADPVVRNTQYSMRRSSQTQLCPSL